MWGWLTCRVGPPRVSSSGKAPDTDKMKVSTQQCYALLLHSGLDVEAM